ncbi:MAG: InlB B-repeat-containing protein [Clostridia bacterium]
MKKSIKGLLVIVLSFILLFATLITPVAAITSSTTQPTISWQRSLEDKATVRQYSIASVGTFDYATAKLMPLTNSIVWDGGTAGQYFTGYSVRSDISWASWRLIDCYSSEDEDDFYDESIDSNIVQASSESHNNDDNCNRINVRLFKGTFEIPQGVNIITAKLGTLSGGAFSSIIPINDNLYVYLNGARVINGGTSYSAPKDSAYAHSDQWYMTSTLNYASALHNGTNTLEAFTEEYNTGGGMSELIMEIETSPIYYTATYYTDCDEETVFTSQSGITAGALLIAPVPAPTRAGFTFEGWEECRIQEVMPSVASDSNLWDFDEDHMPAHDITLCAQWEKAMYTINYQAGANGSISGTTSQSIAYLGSTTSTTAIANPGYHFVAWNDGNTNPTRSEVDVQASATYTASFAADQVIIYDFKQTPPEVLVVITPEAIAETPAPVVEPEVVITPEAIAAAPMAKTGGLSDIGFLLAGVLFTTIGLVYRKKLQKNDK